MQRLCLGSEKKCESGSLGTWSVGPQEVQGCLGRHGRAQGPGNLASVGTGWVPLAAPPFPSVLNPHGVSGRPGARKEGLDCVPRDWGAQRPPEAGRGPPRPSWVGWRMRVSSLCSLRLETVYAEEHAAPSTSRRRRRKQRQMGCWDRRAGPAHGVNCGVQRSVRVSAGARRAPNHPDPQGTACPRRAGPPTQET